MSLMQSISPAFLPPKCVDVTDARAVNGSVLGQKLTENRIFPVGFLGVFKWLFYVSKWRTGISKCRFFHFPCKCGILYVFTAEFIAQYSYSSGELIDAVSNWHIA